MANQPPKTRSGSRWGSLLSGAVAGLESRLDTILAEEGTVEARNAKVAERARQAAEGKGITSTDRPKQDISRTSSIKRATTRLQPTVHQHRSRNESPASEASRPRNSTESARSDPSRNEEASAAHTDEVKSSVQDDKDDTVVTQDEESISASPTTEGLRTKDQEEFSDRQELPTVHGADETDSNEILQSELAEARDDLSKVEEQRQEEMHEYLERIDSLQAKLQYVVQEVLSSVKQIAAEAPSGSLEKKLAEKDEKIVLLMEEGQKLSKAEVTQSTTSRNLRVKLSEESRNLADTKFKLTRIERSSKDSNVRIARLENEKKEANAKVARLSQTQKELKANQESKDAILEDLQRKLRDVKLQANEEQLQASSEALDSERRRVRNLEADVNDLKAELKEKDNELTGLRDDSTQNLEQERERSIATESNLRSEISVLEGRLELIRERNEEASSGTIGDSQAKLMRQIETLQSQYSVANDNWQGIESSLQARVVTLEKERDDTSRHENEARRKARELGTSARRLQDQLDESNHRCQVLEQELAEYKPRAEKLTSRMAELEKTLNAEKAAFECERSQWNTTLASRIEEEKMKWQQQTRPSTAVESSIAAGSSPFNSNRKPSYLDLSGINTRRSTPRQNSELNVNNLQASSSRRSSAIPPRTLETISPNGHDSGRSTPFYNGLHAPPETPSIYTADHDEVEVGSSPHRTVNDMLSASTAGAGPSVQLVERMSASVRRLESEKAASKEELSRIQGQRDEARKEIVSLMREVDQKRVADDLVTKLEAQVSQLSQRYQTTLEMLGEKSERVEELEADVADVKKIYKELIDSTMK